MTESELKNIVNRFNEASDKMNAQMDLLGESQVEIAESMSFLIGNLNNIVRVKAETKATVIIVGINNLEEEVEKYAASVDKHINQLEEMKELIEEYYQAVKELVEWC